MSNMFDFQDDASEALQSKGGGTTYPKFGLNRGAKLTKLAYNPNAGKDGAPAEAVEYEITLPGGKFPYSGRLYAKPNVYVDNSLVTDESSEEYKTGFKLAFSQAKGIMTHIMKAFVSEDKLKELKGFTSFKQWAEAHITLLPQNYQEKELDLFLQYQYNIKEGKDRTYLELPKNMKYGYWIVPAMAGEFTESRDSAGNLSYRSVDGSEHAFKRDGWYMDKPFAFKQGGDESASTTSEALAAPAEPASADSDGLWD